MVECRSPLNHRQAMGQLGLQGFDRLGKTANTLIQFFAGHLVRGHHRLKHLLIDMNAIRTWTRFSGIQLALQHPFAFAQLIHQGR